MKLGQPISNSTNKYKQHQIIISISYHIYLNVISIYIYILIYNYLDVYFFGDWMNWMMQQTPKFRSKPGVRCSIAIFATLALEEPWPRLAKASAMASRSRRHGFYGGLFKRPRGSDLWAKESTTFVGEPGKTKGDPRLIHQLKVTWLMKG